MLLLSAEIQDLLSDGKTPHERRFGLPLTNQYFHLVRRSNITLFFGKHVSRLHQFGTKVLPGVFFGDVLYGITELQHLIDPRHKATLRESKKVLQQYSYNQVWMKSVGWFCGMLLLPAERPRLLDSWKYTLRTSIRRTIQRPNHTVWC